MRQGTTESCYCLTLPRNPEVGLLARCNACWNAVMDEKARLVRENNALRARLGLPGVEAQADSPSR